jgi:hypothetical protein
MEELNVAPKFPSVVSTTHILGLEHAASTRKVDKAIHIVNVLSIFINS